MRNIVQLIIVLIIISCTNDKIDPIEDLKFKDVTGIWAASYEVSDRFDPSITKSEYFEFDIKLRENSDTIPDSKNDSIAIQGYPMSWPFNPPNFKDIYGYLYMNDSVRLRINILYFFYGKVSGDGNELIGVLKSLQWNKEESDSTNTGPPFAPPSNNCPPGILCIPNEAEEREYLNNVIFIKVSDEPY